MKKRLKNICVFLILFFIINIVSPLQLVFSNSELNILYINSYHEGYKWSDDIESAIEAELKAISITYKIDIEYLDAQKINNKFLHEYFSQLYNIFKFKYNNKKIDIIITSDDPAYEFITVYCMDIFNETPIFFCGLNNLDNVKIQNIRKRVTGVCEIIDVRENISIIQKIHPKVQKIHYICDNTFTGKQVTASIQAQINHLENNISFVKVKEDKIEDIKAYVSKLGKDEIVLFGLYFYDSNGKHYSYEEGIQIISEASSVPVYGLWNFSLGNGIVGGKLLDGYTQGSLVTELIQKYLNGIKIEDIPIIEDVSGNIKFDYNYLQKYKIQLSQLPASSDIINYQFNSNKNVLVLHSYNSGFEWTNSIHKGIKDSLLNENINVELYTEYLDLKYINSKCYLIDISKILIEKYKYQSFDLIIVSDDGALNFIYNYMDFMLKDIPIVFCGVNYLREDLVHSIGNITGVIEAYDIKGTIDIMLNIHKDLEKIVIINDRTTTGKANKNNILNIIEGYKHSVKFEFLEDVNMSYVQKYVSQLDSKTAILLMSFNRDKSNNYYAYEDSIKIISDASSVPIYCVWDFLLDEGAIGGMMTNGYVQGENAGLIANRILKGESASNIPIMTEKLNKMMFDKKMMDKFDIKKNQLPDGNVIIINQNRIITLYNNNRYIFNIILASFIILFISIFLLIILMTNRKLNILARTDSFTGLLNRESGIKELEKILKKNNEKDMETIIVFLDINNLKYANDYYGHSEGDVLIQKCVELLKKYVEKPNILCRMGGDEFLVVFSNTTMEEAKLIFKDFSDEYEGLKAKLNKPYTFSISLGFAMSTPENKMNVLEIIAKADFNMYEKKKEFKTLEKG